jgi:uncharacterized protein (TIGR02271 family)
MYMGIFGDVFGGDEDNRRETNQADAKLRLRKEELDIAKDRVQKGEVEISKEIIEEHKTVDVPVAREEVIIERRSLDNEASDTPISEEETIRIPVSEERVNVGKHTVVTGEISAHKRSIEDIEHVDETLKREEARINRIGDPDVIDEESTEEY